MVIDTSTREESQDSLLREKFTQPIISNKEELNADNIREDSFNHTVEEGNNQTFTSDREETNFK